MRKNEGGGEENDDMMITIIMLKFVRLQSRSPNQERLSKGERRSKASAAIIMIKEEASRIFWFVRAQQHNLAPFDSSVEDDRTTIVMNKFIHFDFSFLILFILAYIYSSYGIPLETF